MKFNRLIDATMLRFLIVGVINTLVGTSIMFACYNLLDMGYWPSSAANYIIGSIVSFFLNKHFTFRNTSRGLGVVLRFVVNIAVCWLLAYAIAKPLTLMALGSLTTSVAIQENVAMVMGMCLFTALNYFGQRFFAFRQTDESNESI